jgi:hypothetical protein
MDEGEEGLAEVLLALNTGPVDMTMAMVVAVGVEAAGDGFLLLSTCDYNLDLIHTPKHERFMTNNDK